MIVGMLLDAIEKRMLKVIIQSSAVEEDYIDWTHRNVDVELRRWIEETRI